MSLADPSSNIITLYDILMSTSCAPNPWKARLALNHLHLPYSTTWVPLPSICQLRRDTLKLGPCRKFSDGSDYFTLPILQDPSTNTLIGDSFDIAVYLDQNYGGDLFPALPTGRLEYELKILGELAEPNLKIPLSERKCEERRYDEYARFNTQVDATFQRFVQLTFGNFPFDLETAGWSKAEFAKRAGVACWEELQVVGEERGKLWEGFEGALDGLSKVFEGSGPFVMGEKVCYADFIVGAWLRMMKVTLREEEWEEMRKWHGGFLGKLSDALEGWKEVK